MIWQLQLFATGLMAGLICFVQIVHYPLFQNIPESSWKKFHQQHMRLTSYVVMPIMLVELITAVLLLFYRPSFLSQKESLFLFLLLILIWLATFFIQVPLHQAIAQKRDSIKIQRLVQTNWIRSLLWVSRFLIILKWTPITFFS